MGMNEAARGPLIFKTLSLYLMSLDLSIGNLDFSHKFFGRLVIVFWENFFALCAEHGKSPNGVAKELSISSGAVTSWKKGAVPQSAQLKKIADYFGVTVEYLTRTGKEETENHETQSDDMNLLRFALYGDPAQDVTREQLEDVKRYAAYIRERGKEQK